MENYVTVLINIAVLYYVSQKKLHKTPKTQFHLGHCQLIYLPEYSRWHRMNHGLGSWKCSLKALSASHVNPV
jgi:hypothetical protein